MKEDAIKALIDAVQIAPSAVHEGSHPVTGDKAPFMILQRPGAGVEVQSIKKLLDEWVSRPERASGTATVETIGSFIALTDRHKNDDSAIFCKVSGAPSLTAVIDYHEKASVDGAQPRFGRHRVVYNFPLSQEWKDWTGQSGKALSQTDFAQWVFDHIADLTLPEQAERDHLEALYQTKIGAPTEIVQLSRGLQVSVDSTIKEIRTLQSGEAQLVYEEEHKDAYGAKLIVPGLFMLRIPVFDRAEPSRIPVALRYRRVGAALQWIFLMIRPQDILRYEVEAAAHLVEEETELPVYLGSPEM